MNGELHHACRLTAAVKRTLAGEPFSFERSPYEQEPEFWFLDGSKVAGGAAWMEKLQSQKLREVLFFAPAMVKDHHFLAFAGGASYGIGCFYESKVTFWKASWEFEQEKRLWQITYQESPWEKAPEEKPCFPDSTETFKLVLTEIEQLARKLKEPGFANCFAAAREILCSKEEPASQQYIRLPEHHARAFAAAENAWVFGGMGSWNDSSPFEAEKRGLAMEYKRLTDGLYHEIICALLYAVNQW